MPNGRRKRRARPARRDEPLPMGIADCLRSLRRAVAPLFRRGRRPSGRSAKHLRNAGIEALEALRDLLDEAIDWLREGGPAEIKRIRVQE